MQVADGRAAVARVETLLNNRSEFSSGSLGTFPWASMFNPHSMEENNMKKLGYVFAALGAIAIAAPSIPSAGTVLIKHRAHVRFGGLAEFRDHRDFREHREFREHRDHGWRGHNDRMVII